MSKKMNEELEVFLSSKKSSVRKLYHRGINLFSEWYGKSVKEILEERKADVTAKPNESIVDCKFRSDRFQRELEKFHAYLLKTYALNTVGNIA